MQWPAPKLHTVNVLHVGTVQVPASASASVRANGIGARAASAAETKGVQATHNQQHTHTAQHMETAAHPHERKRAISSDCPVEE